MLLINSRVAPSPIHGFGLFANEFIPKGTRLWEFTPHLDAELSLTDFENLPKKARDYVQFHGFLSQRSGNWHLSFDDVRYINHSKEPNIASDTAAEGIEMPLLATSDIHPGEEILQDYEDFEQEPRFA